MFTLLFTYVFGGAIHVPGGHYVDFLMPGIFVQTVIFGAMSAAASGSPRTCTRASSSASAPSR